MAVTHAPAGFTGTVDQVDEARRFALGGGGRFKVKSSADWALTASSSVDRTVTVAAGTGVACGVIDITTAVETLTFAANGGGTDRFDAVVASFDWSNGSVAFRIVQGTGVIPTVVRTGTTVDTAKINWLPGTRYDAVLGVIRVRPGVTILAPADLYDCRPWGQWSQLTVATVSRKEAIDLDAGGQVKATDTGQVWQWTGSAWACAVARASVSRATLQAIPTGGDYISFSTQTAGSTSGLWSATANPTRITVPDAGEYAISIQAAFALSLNAGGVGVGYRVNGTGSVTYLDLRASNTSFDSAAGAIVKGIALNANDYVEIYALQNTDATRELRASARATVELIRR